MNGPAERSCVLRAFFVSNVYASAMAKVYPGRFTAQVDRDFVVFIIGMRINRWWKVHRWFPVIRAMPLMLKRLTEDQSLGLLGYEQFFRPFPLTTTLISYWESFEHLEKFASSPQLPHLAAWGKFIRSVGDSGDLGIYHETFKVKRADVECIYANMPAFGLASAFKHVPVGKTTETARARITSP